MATERQEIAIAEAIRLAAERDPDRPALTCDGRTLTRRELDLRSNRLARAYERLAVAQDDLVTIALPNSVEFYEASVPVWKLGHTAARLGPATSTRARGDRRAGQPLSRHRCAGR